MRGGLVQLVSFNRLSTSRDPPADAAHSSHSATTRTDAPKHSLVAVGGHWYGFGWESQLLELGFIACLAAPLGFGGASSLGMLKSLPPAMPAQTFVCVAACRWLLFRIMLGAGLIKIRKNASACWKVWRKGTTSCMAYFYETQPLPAPLARRLHFLPSQIHTAATWLNHAVELVLPWLLLVPPFTLFLAGLASWGAVAQIFFQFMLMLGGNFSFLNVLTMVPALYIFDDHFLRGLLHLPMSSASLSG